MNLSAFARVSTGSSICVHDDRCLAVRHKRSSCAACHETCPVNAITACDNSLLIDAHACIGCGACAVACPTGALEMVDVDAEVLAADTRRAMAAANGVAVFACAAMAAGSRNVHEEFVEVPCLACLDESVLLDAVAGGAREVVLADAGCESCPLGGCESAIEETVHVARRLLGECGSAVRISRLRELARSGDCELPNAEREGDEACLARRQLFGDAASSVRNLMVRSAGVEVLRQDSPAPGIYDRRLHGESPFPLLTVGRHERELAALASLADDAGTAEADGILSARGFADVNVDVANCNGCGVCALFCPTGALCMEEGPGGARRIAFTAFACIDCRLCEDVCPRECVTVSPCVSQRQAFECEVRHIAMLPAPPARRLGAVAQAVLAAQAGEPDCQ